MKFPVSSLSLAAIWFATTALAPAQNPEPVTPASTPALVTIPLPPRNDKPANALPTEDGLLREGLNESSHPQAAPILVIKPAPTPVPQSERGVTPRHIQVQHRGVHATKSPSPPFSRSVKPRSPVVSFVYWWNGWVIRTFHSKIGTVMLGTIGAKA